MVAQHTLAAGLAAQTVLEGQLDALAADVVDVGKADHVRGHLGGGVIAAILTAQLHARQLQRQRPRRHIRRDATRDVGELARLVRQHALGDAPRRQAERGLEFAPAGARVHEQARIDDHCVDRGTDRQWLAAAVADDAAVRLDGLDAHMALVALGAQEVALTHLKDRHASGQGERDEPECAGHQSPAPGL